VQFRIGFSHPDYPAECLVAAAFDRENISDRGLATQPGDARSLRGDVVCAGHFQDRLALAVKTGNANGQRNVNAFGLPFW